MTSVVASGYFNPLHRGHIAYLKEARALGGSLVVIVNSDKQVALKGAAKFMDEQNRLSIVRALKFVDFACVSVDDDRSVCRTIELLHQLGMAHVFANGGDVRNAEECREADVCIRLGIRMAFGVGGGEKIASSSDILRRSGVA